MFKNIGKFKIITILVLVTLIIQNLATSVLATGNRQRHPSKSADEALLADWNADNLQYLTLDSDGNTLYDGKRINFHAPTKGDLSSQQQAVLMKGYQANTGNRNTSIQIINNGRISTTNEFGAVSWGDSFTLRMNGVDHVAFCLNRNLPGVGTGSPQSLDPYNDINVIRTLYFGWQGGSGVDIFGGNRNLGIIATSTVLTHFMTGGNMNNFSSNLKGARDLFAKVASSEEVPSHEVGVSRTNLTVSVQNNKQVSQSTRINAWSGNRFNITVPSGMTLINETRSAGNTTGPATATVRGGETVRFEAPLNYSNNWTSNRISGSVKEFQTVIARTNAGFQDVGAWLWSDPVDNFQLRANFEVRQRNIKVNYIDEHTGDILETFTETKNIGSSYSYTPPKTIKNPKGDGDFVAKSTTPRTGTLGNSDLTIDFYYNLQLKVTTRHIDYYTNEIIRENEEDTVSRGDKFSWASKVRTDLKRGNHLYRLADIKVHEAEGLTNDDKLIVGNKNVTLDIYYKSPLIEVGLEKIQVYTAPASEGLPVKVEINVNYLYDSKLPIYKEKQLAFNLYQNGLIKVATKEYELSNIPKKLDMLVSPEYLEVDTKHSYTIRIESYDSEDVVIPSF